MPYNAQIQALSRGIAELLSPAELANKLKRGKPLRIKAGFDPTVSDLHLGHTVVMQKLRQFQDLGHQVIFLIGDYTALVGDPSGRTATRPALTPEEVEKNAATYLDQAFKILDKNKTEVRRNSEWLGKMSPTELFRLAAQYNVARMLEREDFRKRLDAGNSITILEFLYPLLQGYDSVALKADVELGGTDQKFNLAVARDIQRAYGEEPEVILTLPLLVGTDGVKKMSKSYGNYIGVSEPAGEIFGKVMSLTDEGMYHYYEILTSEDLQKVRAMHPKEAKVALGKLLVARYHTQEEADKAAAAFDQVFAQKQKPEDISETTLAVGGGDIALVDLLLQTGLAPSKGEGRRLIQQGGVRVDDVKVEEGQTKLSAPGSYLLQVGKRRFLKVILN